MTAQTPLIDIRPDHWEIVRSILQKNVPHHAVWAFGSRATWKAKEYSDLDLAIITDRPLSLDVSASLSDDFSESDLPWRVDLVDWATTSEAFRKIIERDKVVIQEKRKSLGMANEWCNTTLGRSFQINPTRSIRKGQTTPFIPMDILLEHGRAPTQIAEREFTGSGTKFQNGDTLIARITPCLENGKTAFIQSLPKDVVAHGSTEYIVLTGKLGHSDNLFAYYVARSPEFRSYAIGHMEGTSGRQRVPSSAVEKFPLVLPPLHEQRAIAHILGTLDDKIELNRKQNETLEAMARALFKAWFVDFEPVRAKMEGYVGARFIAPNPDDMGADHSGTSHLGAVRSDAVHWGDIHLGAGHLGAINRAPTGWPKNIIDLFPDRLVESELGEIPEGWKVGTLEELLVLQRGFDLPAKERVAGAYSIIAASGNNGTHNQMMTKGPGVITGRSGVLGKVFLELADFWPLNTTLWVKEFRTASPCYAYELLCGLGLHRFNAGSAVPTLNRNHVHGLPQIIPSPKCVNAYESVAMSLHQRVREFNEQTHSLTQLRDTLLPKLISGELRIPDAEDFLRERGL